MNLLDVAERVNKTTIKLAIDLSSVKQLHPGEEFQCMADHPAEVYIVRGDTVYAFAINADTLVLRAENIDL